MRLLVKFNLAFIGILLIGIPLAIYHANGLLLGQAQSESLERAKLVMGIANSVRNYTVDHVRKELKDISSEFLPVTVPAFASQRVFADFVQTFPEYGYKEASRNPTNVKDKAVGWEDELFDYFIRNKDIEYFEGMRSVAGEEYIYIAHPMYLKHPECLVCHSNPAIAPPELIERYGLNGFGYKLNDLLAVQIVNIPLQVSKDRAHEVLTTMGFSILGIGLTLWILLNLMLYYIIIKPIQSIGRQADLISTSKKVLGELPVKGSDEIAELTKAFNRMQRSMQTSIKLIANETTKTWKK